MSSPVASKKAAIRTGLSTRSSSTTSNDDLLQIILSFKAEVLASNKALSDSQSLQFNKLTAEILKVSEQVSAFKAENITLKRDIDSLKAKISNIEENNSSTSPSIITSQVLQELFERERCSSNVIAYGVLESTSLPVDERILHDESMIINILLPIGNYLPSSIKLTRIGKPRPDSKRPLKIICTNKEEANSLLYQYNELKRSGTQFQNGFKLVKDKTKLERQLLRTCHNDLSSRTAQGESNLRIHYINGVPSVVKFVPKNRARGNYTDRPPVIQLDSNLL